jgi:hypothetical protein
MKGGSVPDGLQNDEKQLVAVYAGLALEADIAP